MDPTQANKKLKIWLAVVSGLAFILLVALIARQPSRQPTVATTAATTTTKAATTMTTTQISTTTETPATSEAKEEPIKISAKQLYAEYEANAVRADQQYKGKLLEVTGVVDEIGTYIMGTGALSITIGSGEDFLKIGRIQCFFKDEAEIEKLMELSKGNTITIIGTHDGMMLTNVLLKKCKIK